MRSRQTDNSYLAEKVKLRLNNLPAANPVCVLELFSGNGHIWNKVREISGRPIDILRIEKKPDSRGIYLRGDNRKFTLDYSAFDVIDPAAGHDPQGEQGARRKKVKEMPIRESQKTLYPANWKDISFKIRTIRAAGRCEECGAQNLTPHPLTGSKVVVCVAHLDHNPANCDGMESGGPMLPKEKSNMRAMCQRCHNHYDGKNRRAIQAETLRAAKLATKEK